MWSSSCSVCGLQIRPEYHSFYGDDNASTMERMIASEPAHWLGAEYDMLGESNVMHTTGGYDPNKKFQSFDDAVEQLNKEKRYRKRVKDHVSKHFAQQKINAAERYIKKELEKLDDKRSQILSDLKSAEGKRKASLERILQELDKKDAYRRNLQTEKASESAPLAKQKKKAGDSVPDTKPTKKADGSASTVKPNKKAGDSAPATRR